MKYKFKALLKRLTFSKIHFSLPERLKGGRVEKWADYWKSVIHDYRTVAVDTFQESKSKPVKTACIGGALSFVAYAVKTNPDEQSFYANLTNANNQLLLLSDGIRSPASETHVELMNDCQNAGLLRRQSLGLFSVMWLSDYHKDCSIYGAQCSYLKPAFATFYRRIIDFGFLGDWHVLKQKMIDFDVNPKEWQMKS